MPLPRHRIAPNGPEFSQLVFGTWRLLDEPALSAQEINRRLNACLDAGLTTIDTAEIYGLYEVEEALGKALALSPGLRRQAGDRDQGGNLRAVLISSATRGGALQCDGGAAGEKPGEVTPVPRHGPR